MKILGVNICLFLLVISTNSAFAQTCCTGGVPLTGTFRINSFTPNSMQVGVTYDYNKIEDFYLDGEKLEDDYIKRATKTLVLQADYAVSKSFAISAVIPYIWTSERTNQLNNELLLSTNGIGDVALVGQYKIPISSKNPLVVGAGLKFPTGDTKKINEVDGFILPANLQPGTGSYDPMFLAQYQMSLSFRKSLVLVSSIYYRINTASSSLTFHERYKFGNEVQMFVGLSDEFLIGSVLTGPSMLFRLRNTQKDEIEDFKNDNTGGTWLYLVPGWNINVTSNVSVGLSAELPIYRKLNGFQLTTTSKMVASVYINFSKNDTEIKQLDKTF